MKRSFSGQLHVRVPSKMHEEVSREAFEKGLSISGICAQALMVRNVLHNIEPWKGIENAWAEGKNVNLDRLDDDIAEAIASVRTK